MNMMGAGFVQNQGAENSIGPQNGRFFSIHPGFPAGIVAVGKEKESWSCDVTGKVRLVWLIAFYLGFS
jgi:hypothetical protein